MAASRYEGECKHCGVVASAKDRNEWHELLRLPCCCGQHRYSVARLLFSSTMPQVGTVSRSGPLEEDCSGVDGDV